MAEQTTTANEKVDPKPPEPPAMFGVEVKDAMSRRLLLYALPAVALLTFVALWFLKSGQYIAQPGDLFAKFISLAIATMFAIGIMGSVTLTMFITGSNIPNHVKYELTERAAKGDRNARGLLDRENILWVLWAGIFACVYLAFV